MGKYLYGASVQGIQGFIFETNKLQEIVGASEIVKGIASDFDKRVKDFDVKILVNAAGNIKALFNNKEECQNIVLDFAKEIEQKAYGITISQAVVKVDGKDERQEDIDLLEKNLKTQRNKPSIPLDMSLNIMDLNPKTAKSLFSYDKRNEPLDKSSKQKREAYNKWYNKQKDKNPNFKELKELSALSNDSKNKLAVIHADGNGLGELIPTLEKNLNMSLSDFSIALDNATQEAFDLASQNIQKIKSIILGGDDLVVICDANEALNFTKDFLDFFEIQTKATVGVKLTACAGIAYTNEKYPFHYAVSLAEELCSITKKHAKELRKVEELKFVPSSLMFHNIQSSNFQSWDKFVKNELTIQNDKESIRCDFGPYYLKQDGQPEIEDFMNTVEAYRQDGSPISRLRNWLSELGKSSQSANNLLKRINEMMIESGKWKCEIMDNNLKKINPKLCNQDLIVKKDKEKDCHGIEQELLKTPIYDVLQILSVTEGK